MAKRLVHEMIQESERARISNLAAKFVSDYISVSTPPFMPLHVLRLIGQQVLFAKFVDDAEHFFSFSYFEAEEITRTIYINKNKPSRDQSFSIAYELGRVELCSDDTTSRRGTIEKIAESIKQVALTDIVMAYDNQIQKEDHIKAIYFASHFLIPTQFLKSYAQVATRDELKSVFIAPGVVVDARLIEEKLRLRAVA
jgi:Zn-dependent peptidase ImmA (M78 family)